MGIDRGALLTIVVLAGFAPRSGAPAELGAPFRRHGEWPFLDLDQCRI
jgi:hypothetical protein